MNVSLRDAARFPAENFVPLAAGLVWIVSAADAGVLGFLFAAVPGVLMVAGSTGVFLTNGDYRTPQLIALGAAVGVIVSLPMTLVVGPAGALGLATLAIAAFFACGWTSLRGAPRHDRVPDPPVDLALAGKVAGDQLALASFVVTRSGALGSDLTRIGREIGTAREQFESEGWLEKPASYHADPPAFGAVRATARRSTTVRFDHLTAESAYEPHPEEPGRDRWLGYRGNRIAHAWVLRAQPERPWLICIHGLGMGVPWIDLNAFEARTISERFALNILLPVLPFHGPRKEAMRSGGGFLEGDMLDTVHAEAQSQWDLRRWLGWLRAEGAVRVGVYGLSLGGYNTALLASLAEGLHCAVAGVPAVDFAPLVRRLAPPRGALDLESIGIPWTWAEDVFRVVSPLALEPKVVPDGRYIFGGTADQLVPPNQVRDLWRHWGEPRIAWYAGSHLSFGREPEVRVLLHDAFTRLADVASA